MEILDKELKEAKQEKDIISSKMYAYELKGLDDWRTYLKGKYFETDSEVPSFEPSSYTIQVTPSFIIRGKIF